MRRAVLASIVLAAIVLVTTIARAEPPLTGETPSWSVQPVDGTAPVEYESYRAQLVVADLAALGLLVVGADGVGPPDVLTQAAIGTYALGAPLVHLGNGHGLRAVASLALRVALPAAGAAIGVRLQGHSECTSCIDNPPPLVGLIFGLGVGGLTAVVLDYAVVGKPVKVTRSGWVPSATPLRGGATVGVSGGF